MRIQRKNDQLIIVCPARDNVVETEKEWFVLADGGMWYRYGKNEYEEVPDEPKLVDVTKTYFEGEAECWRNYRRVMQGKGGDLVLPEGYEWRKIEAYVLPESIAEQMKDPYSQKCLTEYKQSVLTIWGPPK